MIRIAEKTASDDVRETEWMEYKTIRQYPAMGEALDSMRQYGYRGGIETLMRNSWNPSEDRFQDSVIEDFLLKD